MTIQYVDNSVVYEENGDFDILCDGNLEWKYRTNSHLDDVPQKCIGRMEINGKFYIGSCGREKDFSCQFKSGKLQIPTILENMLNLLISVGGTRMVNMMMFFHVLLIEFNENLFDFQPFIRQTYTDISESKRETDDQ